MTFGPLSLKAYGSISSTGAFDLTLTGGIDLTGPTPA